MGVPVAAPAKPTSSSTDAAAPEKEETQKGFFDDSDEDEQLQEDATLRDAADWSSFQVQHP